MVAVEKCKIILFEDAEQKAIFSIEDFIKDQENVEVGIYWYKDIFPKHTKKIKSLLSVLSLIQN